MSQRIDFDGVIYESYKELFDCKACNGLTYAAFYRRIKSGWSVEKALNDKKHKSTNRVYVVDEKKFQSLKELSISAGISYNAAVKRAHRGFSDKEIFYGKKIIKKNNKPKEKGTRGKPITVLGVVYGNLRFAYEALKPSCTYNSLIARLRYNWSLEEAFEVVQKVDGRTEKTKTLDIDGKIIPIKEASVQFGVPESTIHDRLKRGASDKLAISKDRIKNGLLLSHSEAYKNTKKRIKKVYEVDGVEYSSVPALARAYNLPAPLVYNRMRDNGWSAERAVKESITDSVTVDGITYRSAMSAWEKIGQTNFSTYQGRKSKGYEVPVCLGLEPLPLESRYFVQGRTFSSIAEVANFYNLTPGQLNSRLNNMDLEQAVIYQPSNGRYSRSVFNKNPTLAKSAGVLYLVKVSLQDGMLHKVGITLKETSQRFQNFKYIPIIEIKGTLAELFEIEQSVVKKYKHLHYRAEEEFEGKTETFLFNNVEEKQVVEFIKSQKVVQKVVDIHKLLQPNNHQKIVACNKT